MYLVSKCCVPFRILTAIFLIITLSACESPEEKAKSHYESGVELFEKNEFIKAGLEFRNALQLDRNITDAWYKLAIVEEHRRNWDNVSKFLLSTIALDPKHLDAYNRLSGLLLAGGRIPEALKFNNTAFELAPKNSQVLALKAAIQFRLGEKETALREAEKSLEADSENINARIVLAAIKLDAKDPDGALQELDSALVKNERNVALNLFKIRVLEQLESKQQIESLLQKLIAFYPETDGFKSALVNFYINEKRNDEAEKILRSILAKKQDDLNAAMNVVRFENTFKGKDAAQKELEGLIKKADKNQFQYQLAMVQLFLTNDDTDAAQSILEEVISKKSDLKNVAVAQNQLAQLLLSKGDTEQAGQIITQVLESDARNVDALALRASLRLNDLKYEDAITDLRTALNEAPENSRVLVILSRAHELNGSVDLAEDRINLAAKTAKYAPNVGLQYVQFLMRQQKFARAEEVLERVLQNDPRNRTALVRLAELRLRQGNWLGAEQAAESLSALGEKKQITGQIIGAALQGQNKFGESINALKEAFEDAPEAVRPMVSLFQAYVRAEKLDEAETFLNSVLSANPDSAEAHVLMGNLSTLRSQPDKAEAFFKQAIEKQPKSTLGYRALANYYLQNTQQDDAVSVIQTGIESVEDNFSLNLILATIFTSMGRTDDAVALYEKLNQERPRSFVVANNLASIYSENSTDQQKLDRAFQIVEPFRGLQIPHVKDTLGWILHKRGESEKAVPLLRQAAKGLPNMPAVRYHLGMSFKNTKQYKQALEELQKAVELAKDNPQPFENEVKKVIYELEELVKSPPTNLAN